MLPETIVARKVVYYDTAMVRRYLEDMTIDPGDENVLDLVHTWAEEDFSGRVYGLFDEKGNAL